MKNIFLITIITFLSTVVVAQNQQSAAFSESYTFEYNKEYAKAIASIDKVYDANSYEINLRLGWLTYMNADFMKSQTYYKNAMKLSPESIEAMLGYAYPTSSLENWEDVIDTYKKILVIDAHNYTVNSRLATIYYYRKDFKTAQKFGEEVNNHYPFDFNNNVLLGRIYVSLGNITKAKTFLNKALLYNPSSNVVLELLKTL